MSDNILVLLILPFPLVDEELVEVVLEVDPPELF